MKGKSNKLLKMTAKRRRSKAAIQEEKMNAEREKQEIAAKMA